MKIALLMTSYKNKAQIERLIEHLSKDFDIYIHIDKRSKLEIQERQNVFVYQKYKSYWGSFNQIMAILFLFQQAYERGYDRYLLISDNDLPLKTNQQIKDFFANNDNEYFSSVKLPAPDWDRGVLYRVLEYFPNVKKKDHRPLTWKIARFFLKLLGKRPLDYEFYGGSDWFNFTHNCLKKMFDYLKVHPQYIKRFRWTYVASEIFFQTLFYLADGVGGGSGLKVINNTLRYIDWETGPEGPRIMRKEDFKKLEKAAKESDALFARRFDKAVDADIIEMVYQDILQEKIG